MADTNGDIKVETAESFARDYLDDLFNNNKNLGAFEEETLDINIKSKYDDMEIEEENNAQSDSNIAQFTVESSPVVNNVVEELLEPGNETFQVNGHADSIAAEVTSHNSELENGVIEPNQSEFTSQVTEQVSQLNIVSDPIEPSSVSQFESINQSAQIAEEEEEEEDVVAPIPMSRAKSVETPEEELSDLQFKKLGLSKNWWDSKRTETENQKDGAPGVDKFRTIKQNIKRGNTRSLLARFENMSKLTE